MFNLSVNLPSGYSTNYSCNDINYVESLFAAIITTLVKINGECHSIIFDRKQFDDIFKNIDIEYLQSDAGKTSCLYQ